MVLNWAFIAILRKISVHPRLSLLRTFSLEIRLGLDTGSKYILNNVKYYKFIKKLIINAHHNEGENICIDYVIIYTSHMNVIGYVFLSTCPFTFSTFFFIENNFVGKKNFDIKNIFMLHAVAYIYMSMYV